MSEFISKTGMAAKGRALTKNECRMIELEYRQWADNEIKELRARVAELERVREIAEQIRYIAIGSPASNNMQLIYRLACQQADEIEKAGGEK